MRDGLPLRMNRAVCSKATVQSFLWIRSSIQPSNLIQAVNPRCIIRRALVSALVWSATCVVQAQVLPVTNNIKLWLKADAGVTTNSSGGVAQWDDLSGNVNTANGPGREWVSSRRLLRSA